MRHTTHWAPVRRSVPVSLAALVALMVCGCAAEDEEPTAATERTTTADGSATETSPPPTAASQTDTGPIPALIGEWQRTQKCAELVGVLTQYGMKSVVPSVLAEDGWIPGVTEPSQIDDPAHPCQGAVTRKHSHFFTPDGNFGSRDDNGNQVDDGQYKLVGDDTVIIGDGETRFHYHITGGDTIAFEPVVPNCAPKCFEAIWSVVVAYPGHTWHRIS